jgi:hypothetical protein
VDLKTARIELFRAAVAAHKSDAPNQLKDDLTLVLAQVAEAQQDGRDPARTLEHAQSVLARWKDYLQRRSVP